jgi:hypothetical protein
MKHNRYICLDDSRQAHDEIEAHRRVIRRPLAVIELKPELLDTRTKQAIKAAKKVLSRLYYGN